MAEEKKKDEQSFLRDALKILSPLFLNPTKPGFNLPGTINQSRRAEALLRGINRRLQTGSPAVEHTPYSSSRRITLPAIGRTADMLTLNNMTSGDRPLSTIAFGFDRHTAQRLSDPNRRRGRVGSDMPFRYGLSDPKNQALRYILGNFMDNVPEKSVISGRGIDRRRRLAYTRYTGGAIGPGGRGYRNAAGNFQGFDANNRFMKAVPNPTNRLQAPLLNSVRAGLEGRPLYQAASPVLRRVLNVDPRVQALLTVNDVVEAATGKGPLSWFTDFATEYKKDTGVSLNPAAFFP